MALPPELRAVNDAYREQNEARYARVFESPEPAPYGPDEAPEPRPVAPLQPWMRSARTGRWCVRWNTVGQNTYDRFTHRAETSADLVRFMRDEFKGSAFIRVWRVWYDDRPGVGV